MYEVAFRRVGFYLLSRFDKSSQLSRNLNIFYASQKYKYGLSLVVNFFGMSGWSNSKRIVSLSYPAQGYQNTKYLKSANFQESKNNIAIGKETD